MGSTFSKHHPRHLECVSEPDSKPNGKKHMKTSNNADAKRPANDTGLSSFYIQGILDDTHLYAGKSLPDNYAQNLFPWAPPTYSSVFDHARTKSFSNPEHTKPFALDDPIVASAQQNQTRPLYILPAGVLIKIIEKLDDVSIECFRRAARKFSPLCAEVIFCRYPERDYAGFSMGPCPWPTDLSLRRNAVATAQFLRSLDKDRYCRGCLMARRAAEWKNRVARLREYLHCSACRAEHPACLFSAEERVKSHRRHCIGHQGYMRICGHDEGIIKWSDVLHLVQNRKTAKKPGHCPQVRWQCTDKSHLSACGVPEDALSREEAPEQCGLDPLNETRRLFPTLETDQQNSIHVVWSVHLPLGRLGEWPPTARILRRHLGEIRANAGRFIFPTTTPVTKLPELRVFDPNECDCVHFEGSEDLDWRPYRPVSDWLEPQKCCANNPESRLVPLPHLLDISPSNMQLLRQAASSRPIKVCVGSGRCELKDREHLTHSRWLPRYSETDWSMSAVLCHNTSPCLRLNYFRALNEAISADGKQMMRDWYRALDTESYDLVRDEEGFEVFWCREPHCRNNYGSCPDFDALVSGAFYPYENVPESQQLMYHRK